MADTLPDWFSFQRRFFERNIPFYPIRALQIGAYKGDMTSWMLDNREVEFIHDLDLWQDNGELQHLGLDFTRVESVWDFRHGQNTRVSKFKMSSDEYFASCTNTFNFIYIDGDHSSIQTCIDSLNAWKVLDQGGLIAFDDYLWDLTPSELMRPKRGIDAFLQLIKGEYELIESKYQVWIRKDESQYQRLD